MAKTKQIIVVGVVAALVAVLLAQAIEGLVNEKEEAAQAEQSSSEISLENVSLMTKQGLDANLIKDISDIETQIAKFSYQIF
jgi:hypothetical protein